MRVQKNKILSAIAIMLLLASTAFLFSSQTVNAQTSAKATYAFIACNPNPVGVGQALQVSFWLADAPPTASDKEGDRWQTFSVKITLPDGSIENKGPFTSDAVGAAYFVYYPTQTGTYSFVMSYTGQTITGSTFDWTTFTSIPFSSEYLPSTSNVAKVTVQSDSVTGTSQAPLPTSYWTRPITGINVDWKQISSNWLMSCWNQTSSANQGTFGTVAVQDEGKSPDSGHVLWTIPMTMGGLVGGSYDDVCYHQGLSYEKFLKPIIINGFLYYDSVTVEQPIMTGTTDQQGIICVDMTTGEQVFTIPNATLTYGQIYTYISPNQAGAYAYIISVKGSTWHYYDAFTGSYLWQISGVPSGTAMFGPSGEILVYSISSNSSGYYLNLWNSTNALLFGDGVNWYYRPATGGSSWGGSTTTGYTTIINGDLGIQWAVEIQNYSQSIAGTDGDNIVTKTGYTFTEYSMTDGSFRSKATLTIPTSVPVEASMSGLYESMYSYLDNNGRYFSFLRFTMQWVCWNVRTGAVNWISEPYENAWGMYMSIEIEANGLLYAGGYDGLVQAYNVTNG
ncbi:MAG: hypothetical protein GX638_07610, partial [Crenarchaeota archaeon]|nr:hypothetical protein [Thermoproteota archaeon]